MGTFAEDCAATFGFTREAQDAFALDVALARARREQRRHVRVGDDAGHQSPAARATS
jgi:acetyl-CoA acetyltransferase